MQFKTDLPAEFFDSNRCRQCTVRLKIVINGAEDKSLVLGMSSHAVTKVERILNWGIPKLITLMAYSDFVYCDLTKKFIKGKVIDQATDMGIEEFIQNHVSSEFEIHMKAHYSNIGLLKVLQPRDITLDVIPIADQKECFEAEDLKIQNNLLLYLMSILKDTDLPILGHKAFVQNGGEQTDNMKQVEQERLNIAEFLSHIADIKLCGSLALDINQFLISRQLDCGLLVQPAPLPNWPEDLERTEALTTILTNYGIEAIKGERTMLVRFLQDLRQNKIKYVKVDDLLNSLSSCL